MLYENLINLILSDNPDNYEIFHLYYNLDEKLNALDWFWNEKVHTLNYEFKLDKDVTFSYYDTRIMFNLDLTLWGNGDIEIYDIDDNMFQIGDEFIYSTLMDNGMNVIISYLIDYITQEHEKRHNKPNQFGG